MSDRTPFTAALTGETNDRGVTKNICLLLCTDYKREENVEQVCIQDLSLERFYQVIPTPTSAPYPDKRQFFVTRA